MNEDKIKNLLITIGLKELEINCYLGLLKKSPQRASELAKRLETPKATVLAALQRLSDKFGVVKKYKQKNSFLFLVEDALDLIKFLERQSAELTSQQKAARQLLPYLRSLQNFEVAKPKIYYFEGKEGLKQAFNQVLEEADEIIGYGSLEDDIKYLPKVYPEYYQKRVAKKIPVKGIMPATAFNNHETLTKKEEQRHLRQTHLIPPEFNYPIQVNIYKRTAVFFSLEENFALMIKSRAIAECLKKIFEYAFAFTGRMDQAIRQKK